MTPSRTPLTPRCVPPRSRARRPRLGDAGLHVAARLHARALHRHAHLRRLVAARRDDRGQSTAEYALVMLGAAAVALMVVAWANQTDKIGRLLDGVVDTILDKLSQG